MSKKTKSKADSASKNDNQEQRRSAFESMEILGNSLPNQEHVRDMSTWIFGLTSIFTLER